MKVIELTEATETLATYAAEVAQGPVIITVAGKPVAALVAIENADLETVSLSTNPAFLALIERSRARRRREDAPVQRCAAGEDYASQKESLDHPRNCSHHKSGGNPVMLYSAFLLDGGTTAFGSS